MGEKRYFGLLGAAGAALAAGLIWFNAATSPKPVELELYRSAPSSQVPETTKPPAASAGRSGPGAAAKPPEASSGQSIEAPVLGAYPELEELRIPINTASQEELQLLPGIGEVKAAAIHAYVAENGPIQSLEELLNVKGIGEKTLEKIIPYLVLDSAASESAGG